MLYMFGNAKLEELDVSKLDTGDAEDMSSMFLLCYNLLATLM